MITGGPGKMGRNRFLIISLIMSVFIHSLLIFPILISSDSSDKKILEIELREYRKRIFKQKQKNKGKSPIEVSFSMYVNGKPFDISDRYLTTPIKDKKMYRALVVLKKK